MFNFLKRKPKVPSVSWFESADREVDFTPDLWKLEQYEWQLLFVYDEIMRSHREYRIIMQSSFFACDAFTVKPFELWKKDLGRQSFPIAIEADKRPPWRVNHQKIRGEVHAVRPQTYLNLDKYKQNGLEFLRKKVHILVPDKKVIWTKEGGKETKPTVRLISAWMYVGISRYWDEQIAHSSVFKDIETYEGDKPYIAKYSYFTKKEYG